LSDKRTVLVTGATGFLGSYILKRLLDEKDISLLVLARSKREEAAEERIKKTLKYFFGENKYKNIIGRIRIVEGEVDKDFLGLDDKTRRSLTKEIDEIYHLAAIAAFKVPLDVIRRSNVKGTENVLEFAMGCKNKGKLSRVNHISTTYVAGIAAGMFYENQLDVGQGFNNTYEQSKFEAELVVHNYIKKGLDVTIFRPSVLTGDSISGKTSNFKMLYQPLHFFAAELFDAVPVERATQENLIPVDSAAEAIYCVANEKDSKNKTCHICSTAPIELGHFIDVASNYFGFKKPELIPLKYFDMKRLTPTQKNLIEPYIPYFNYNTFFDSANANRILSQKGFRYPVMNDEFLIKLFRFCAESGFIRPKRHYVAAG